MADSPHDFSDQPVYSIDPDEVTVPEKRQRRKIDRKELNKLKASLLEIGQMSPGLCSQEGDELLLISGHRRLLACKEASMPYRYCLVSEIPDEHKRMLMELHENTCRVNLEFADEAEAHAEIHKCYMKLYGVKKGKRQGWTLEKTAAELGVSVGTLTEDIELSKYAKAVPEVAKASTKTEAKKIVKRLKTGVIRSEALKRAVEKQTQTKPETEAEEKAPAKSSVENKLATLIETYSSKVLQGEMEALVPTLEPFDIVFFDPPWGVNYQDRQHKASSKSYEDSDEVFFDTLKSRLEVIYSVMKEDSHLFLKFAITYHQFVYDALEEAGFSTERIPIIWVKAGQHRTRHPELWPGRCYEPIAFARKGKKRLAVVGQPNLISTPVPSKKMRDIHPSVTHPELSRKLLLLSAKPGDRVLDPMAGSCMTAVACEALRSTHMLDYVMIEKEKEFCDLGISNLLKGFARIIGEAELEDEGSANYKETIPGSPEWTDIWNKHPELRDEMISWSQKERK